MGARERKARVERFDDWSPLFPRSSYARIAMGSGREHIYYADLNCPFCYALDERIHQLGLTGSALWRGVQHLLTAEQWQEESPERLAEEVARVQKHAPELTINVPPRRPPTGLAILTLAELELSGRAAGPQLRRALYWALWVEGQDISSARVIDEACRALGFDTPKPSSNARSLAQRWQREWEGGDFDRCIPVLVAPSGARSVGLEESRRVAAFLKAGLLSSENDDRCRGPESS